MVIWRAAVFLVGASLVALTLRSAIRTMLVPRGLPSTMGRFVFEAVRGVLRLRMGRRPDYNRRDRTMALLAPVSMVTLPVLWMAVVVVGYTCMYWSLDVHPVRAALNLSGSSLFTLGFADPGSLPRMVLSFSQAGIGMGLLALLITFLPILYATFNRRELAVALLETRADSPPSGPNMIIRYHRIEWHGGLTAVWKDWETWFADVEETHTSLPALVFFRSPQPDRSWVTAAGAVLDAASLVASTVEGARDSEAELCIRAGYVALRSIADFFDIEHDHDPRPDDPISVSRAEYDAVCQRLAAEGVPLKEDLDQAWRDFAGWRVNYDRVLIALATLTMAPEAPWSSDRSEAFRRPPLLRRRRSVV